MKTKLLLLVFLIKNIIGFAQTTYVPDNNFENYLETHDAIGNVVAIGDVNSMGNGIANDDYVTTANINTVTILNVDNNNIIDLTGIEDFTNLTELWCRNNQIRSLDVSNNTALTRFSCAYNQINSLDLSNNINLIELGCHRNYLSTLDVSANIALIQISCGANQLSSLDISTNKNLALLYCNSNQLNSLDVSNNALLYKIWCYDNKLNSLDVSNNIALIYLLCNDNQLSSLDLRNGNNTSIEVFNATNNPNLACVYVDDSTYSSTNWTDIDANTIFVNNESECNVLSTTSFNEDLFVIYPNPATAYITIITQTEASYSIFSINGQELQKSDLFFGHNDINISNISNGTYFLTVKTERRISTKILIKN